MRAHTVTFQRIKGFSQRAHTVIFTHRRQGHRGVATGAMGNRNSRREHVVESDAPSSATCQQREPTSVVCDVPLAKTLPKRAEHWLHGVTVEWRGISKREAFAKIQRYLTMGLIAAPCGRPSYRGKPFGNVRC